MTSFASESDLVSNSYDPAAVAGALSWATSVISSYCNRNFDLVTGETVFIDPYRGTALLPNFPVTNVSAVAGYLPDPEGTGMAWVPLLNYRFVAATGMLYDTTGLPGTVITASSFAWPWLPGSLRVTYDHGYDTIPAAIRDVCVRLTQQYLENPTLMVQRHVGDMEARFSGSAGATLNALDRAILDRYSDVGLS